MHSFKKTVREREEEADEVKKEVSAEDEILSLVETDEKGNLEEDEIRMIKGVFDLNDRVVREVMTPRVSVDGVSIDMTIEEAKKKFVESSYSRLPVYREKIDDIIGILYAKDFLNEEKVKDRTIETIMHPANFIQESKPLDDLLEEFKKSQNHFAVVSDQFGGTAGIITIEDVLEEIVGDIRDEYDGDEEDQKMIIEADGSLTVDAKVNLEEINRLMPVNQVPLHNDYDTIGGCIYSEISRIPVIGEIIELEQYTAKILDADERSIKRLKLTPKELEEEPPSKG
jgi:CBS domain containing-hemolysin-like protein